MDKRTERDQDTPDVYAIPANYKIPFAIFGRYPARNVMEGVALGLGTYKFLTKVLGFTISGPQSLMILILISGLPLILGVTGIRGEPISQYLFSIVGYFKTRRVMSYKRIQKSPEVIAEERRLKESSFTENKKGKGSKKDKKKKKQKKKASNYDPNKKNIIQNVLESFGFTMGNAEDNVQDFIGIKRIKNGIIETNDFRYIKIVEVKPINFLLRSARERNQIIRNFARVIRVSPEKIQFKTITKKVDSGRHIELLKKEMSEEENEKTRELFKAYIDLVRESGEGALTRRFFIIFEYEHDKRGGTPQYSQVVKQLEANANTITGYMERVGNPVVKYKSVEEENKALNEFYYEFFNKRSSINEPFSRRYRKVFSDTMIAKGRDPKSVRTHQDISDGDFIAPRGIDLSNFDYTVIDGMYYSFLMIRSDGYKPRVIAGWSSELVNMGEGIDVDIHMRKIPRDRAMESVRRELRQNLGRSITTSEMSEDAYDIADSVQSSRYLVSNLRGGQDLVYMTTIITITAPQLSILKAKQEAVLNKLRSSDYNLTPFPFRQEKALKSVMPLNYVDPLVYKIGKRNTVTTGAASSYTFTSFEMSDENGILIGMNNANKSLVIVDIFNTSVYSNANITILGKTGAGKTYLIQLIALRMRMRGIQVFIIAPDKGHEYRHACESVGGTYVNISASSPHCINIMEIRPTTASEEAMLDMGAMETSLLMKKAEQLRVFFSLLIKRELEVEEESIVDSAIMRTYQHKGITKDNDSLILPGDEDAEKPRYKEMPILEDLYNELIKIGEENEYYKKYTQPLSLSMSRYIGKGSMSTFNNQTNVDLNNKYIVLDITQLKKDMLPIGMFIVLEYCWDKIREDRSKPKAIIIDETWQLISESAESARFVFQIFKTIRAYAGSAIAATQDLEDFYTLEDGKYGKAIINGSQTKIILGLEPSGAKTVRDVVGLTDVEYTQVQEFQRGQALFLSNSNKIQIDVMGSQVEHDLITTDRKDLAERLEREKKQRKNKK